MRSLNILVAGLLASMAQAIPSPASHVVHEKRNHTPSKWVKRGKTHPEAVLPVRVGLKQNNLHRGDQFLMDVSDPHSPNYGKHWTSEEVIEMFKPSSDTVDSVRSWLVASGIHDGRITHTDNKAWLAFDATAEEMESLLHTEYHDYEHTSTGHLTAACDSYHVPKEIKKHIDYITPGIALRAPVKKRSRGVVQKRGHGMTSEKGLKAPPMKSLPESFGNSTTGDVSNCDEVITPACIAALYQVPRAPRIAQPGNALGIFEEGDYYSQYDLDAFFANQTTYIPQGTHPTPAFIDGAKAPVVVELAGGESDLDFELAYPLIYPQNITLFQTDDLHYATDPDSTSTGGFNTFLDALDGSYCTYSAFGETGNDPTLDPIYPDTRKIGGYNGTLMCGVYKPTNVISVSYGGQEYDLPAYYQQRQCHEFLKLGLQGVSIFYASGDAGVAGPAGDDSENGCLGNSSTIFSPTWPNSCPYITNVGATKVYPGHTVYEPESAVVDPIGEPYSEAYSSGGGFSNIYGVPSYQADAVSKFFADHNPSYPYYTTLNTTTPPSNTTGLYNRLGRGYPDVAANGDNIFVSVEGYFGTSGGTSASTPIFASIINRINEERLAANKSTVGFVNPVLYKNPQVLNDITNGTNPGCGTEGFSAVEGWDPVTGLGTPNFPKMLELFMSLP